MKATYQYNSRKRRPAGHFLLRAGEVFILIVAVGAGLYILISHYNPHQKVINGKAVVVAQASTTASTIHIIEPTFTINLPSDWVQIASEDNPEEHYVTWEATAKNYTNRYLTIYIDIIPTTIPVNRELPITANGNKFIYGQISDNCSNFTPGGTQDTALAVKILPTPSVWENVNFICDIPRVTDNQVGSGTPGEAVNTATITGPKNGTHKYFFLYTDRNIQPDDSIFYNAVDSFTAL